MKKYENLNVQEKIQIKQYAMNVHGKRWHTAKPNFIGRLDEIEIHTILSGRLLPLPTYY